MNSMKDLSALKNENVCFSGGANGADIYWGLKAREAGHVVIHWVFKGHNTDIFPDERFELTFNQLLEADPHLKNASSRLHRNIRLGPNVDKFSTKLIRRNYFQIRYTNSLYGVGSFDSSPLGISGGTAWAFSMAIDANVENLYFYEQNNEQWYSYDKIFNEWSEIKSPPAPSGLWTGIGSRNLNQSGRDAINQLFP